MQYSCFASFGQLKFSSQSSRHQQFYEAMREGQGNAFGPNDVHQEARVYASSHCLAVAWGQIERAELNQHPHTVSEQLDDMERDYGAIPKPSDTDAERRARLEIRRKYVRGSRYEAITDALSTLLGSKFVRVITHDAFESPPTTWPADPATNGNYSKRATFRLYSVALSIPSTGSHVRSFVDVVPGQPKLAVGDVIVYDAGSWSRAEAITVAAVTHTTDALGYTTSSVTATYAGAHDPNAICTTARFPLIASEQRRILVQVTSVAALDAPTRRSIDDLMRRIVRGVSTWDICDDSGPFTIDGGLIGVTTIGALP